MVHLFLIFLIIFGIFCLIPSFQISKLGLGSTSRRKSDTGLIIIFLFSEDIFILFPCYFKLFYYRFLIHLMI